MDHAFSIHPKRNYHRKGGIGISAAQCYRYMQTLSNENISLYFFVIRIRTFCPEKKRMRTRLGEWNSFFAPFVWISLFDCERAEIAGNVIQFSFSGPLSYRSAIVLLSSRFFHLQFIKINSYRYFGYGRRWRKENNTSAVTTTPHQMKSGRKSHFVFFPGIQDLVGQCLYALDEKTCWSPETRGVIIAYAWVVKARNQNECNKESKRERARRFP